MFTKNQKYVVRGAVLGRSGRPLSGFEVVAYDKDLLRSELLGRTKTDADGRFEIRFEQEDFDDFLEGGPDVVLQVMNDKGQAVHMVDEALRKNAGPELIYQIELDDVDALEPKLDLARKYFGSFVKLNELQVGKISSLLQEQNIQNFLPTTGGTKYEELHCLGLRRSQDLLEAIFEVKLPYGFNGTRCSEGSREWVTFFVDWEGNGVWEQVAPAVATQVHDLDATRKGSVWYAAQAAFNPEKHLKDCKTSNVVRVRAILSWEVPHLNPNTLPVWGNRTDAWVVLRDKLTLVPHLGIELLFPGVLGMPPMIPFNYPKVQAVTELQAKLKDLLHHAELGQAQLPEKRAHFKRNILSNPNYYGSISKAKDLEGLKVDLGKYPKSFWDIYPYPKDLAEWIHVEILKEYNVGYEECTCLGLAPGIDTLESTIAIKLPNGYGTGACGWGSTEFVAYYIDYGDGAGWEYVGTDKVTVYDEPQVRDERPLMYASKMYVNDMRKRAAKCSKEQVVKARAILSWEVPPTPGDPDYFPTWGNVIDSRVEVAPSLGQGANPIIQEVSDIDVAAIIPATGLTMTTGQPFGGHLAIWGQVQVAGASHYRLQFKKSGEPDSAYVSSMKARPAQRPGTVMTDWRSTVGDGWFDIAQYVADLAEYASTMLGYIDSTGLEGMLDIRIQVGDGVTAIGTSAPVTVQLDNKDPQLYTFAGETIPNMGVTVKNSVGSYQPCGLFRGNEAIDVFGNFEDSYYQSFSLELTGGLIAGWQYLGGGTRPSPGLTGTALAGPGNTGQSLLVFNMPADAIKCAYAIQIWVADRAIVGYAGSYAFSASNHVVRSAVTFDYEP